MLNNDASDGNSKEVLDLEYKNWNKQLTDEKIQSTLEEFKRVLAYIDDLHIDFDRYKLKGVSHFYALFAFCKKMIDQNIKAATIQDRIDTFYLDLRLFAFSAPGVRDYLESMQSNTRSKSQRLKRINALVEGCFQP